MRLLPPPERRWGFGTFVVLFVLWLIYIGLMIDQAGQFGIVGHAREPIWTPIFLLGLLPGSYFAYLFGGLLYFEYTGKRPPGVERANRVSRWLLSDVRDACDPRKHPRRRDVA